jgi:3-keto-disaccharide hydrolase
MNNFLNHFFKKIVLIVLILSPLMSQLMPLDSVKTAPATISDADSIAIEGRWDITIDIAGKKMPSWLEVHRSGIRTLVGEFVGTGGSARPISVVNFAEDRFSFSIPPQWENEDSNLVVWGTVYRDSLSGTMKFSNGKTYRYVGVRAPSLKWKGQPVWGKPVRLFNGTNLEGWHATGINQWIVDSGFLRSPQKGSNLETDKTFTDFKLHIEFRYPPRSNSGIYLRGRYEVQIEDLGGEEPVKNEWGSIYGFIAPSEHVAKGSGKWQSFDITLVGRMVTVVANGITIICNQEIPGITGGAINSNEGEPGPILIQGDHDPIDIRNVILTPAK